MIMRTTSMMFSILEKYLLGLMLNCNVSLMKRRPKKIVTIHHNTCENVFPGTSVSADCVDSLAEQEGVETPRECPP